ncbi:MAG TPA: hypothetical protein VFZ61_25930 [Polyangiales bacterium]
MSTPPADPPPPERPSKDVVPPAPPVQDSGTKGDMVALGIGCGVFLILLVAIILVGMSGR